MKRLILLAVALLFAHTGWAGGAPPGPTSAPKSYAGRTLDEWREVMKDLDPNDAGSAAAVPGLLEIVQDREVPWFTRRQAALTLGRMGALSSDKAVPVLIGLLDERSGDDEQATRVWAIKALALFDEDAREATPALIEILRNPAAPPADRLVTLEALARIGTAHRDAVPAIIAVLRGAGGAAEQENALRELAAEALALVGPGASEGVPALIRAVRDPDERLRRKSIQALAAMGGAAAIAVPVLAEAMVLDESPAVRDAAADALSRIGPAALPALTHFLADEDTGTRRRAALALGAMGRPARSAVPQLQAALQDESPEVRIEAVDALWKITFDPALVIPAVLAEFTAEDRQVRIRAFRLLSSMGDKARPALDELRRLARHDRPYVRQAAEKAIERIESE